MEINGNNQPTTPPQRLESYQRGGSGAGDGFAGDGDANALGSDTAIAAILTQSFDANGGGVEVDVRGSADAADAGRRPFIPQFSLIGQSDSFAEASDDRCISWCTGGVISIIQRRKSVLLACATTCLLLLAAMIRGAEQRAVPSPSSPASGPTAPPAASAADDAGSCPIRSSYSVPADVMGLKNSSCVENVKNGAVSSDQPICSQVGLSTLRDARGNAADAAVATALCLGVVNPASSGIGGGAFILVHSESESDGGGGGKNDGPAFEDARGDESGRSAASRTEFIDCRETAPERATYDMFESHPESSIHGGLAIAIPGELRGLELLHHRHGTLPWEDVVRPAMELARDGFAVGPYLASAIRRNRKYIRTMPSLAHALTKDNDGVTLLNEGDVMIRSQYAKTLETIMYRGADALYNGDLAGMLAKDIQDAGGIITTSDLSNYQPVLRDPIISRVAGYTVVGAPPPSSGGAVIIGALRFLSGFATPYSALLDTLSKHWYVEACRHVFAIRMSLSDPKFAPEENANAVADLTKGEYMDRLRQLTLDNTTLALSRYGGTTWTQLNSTDATGELLDAQEGDRRRRISRLATNSQTTDDLNTWSREMRLFNYLEDHGTSSFTVVDENRSTVIITSSVNLEFGSKIHSPSLGINLNNQMDDFSSPGQTNFFGVYPSPSNYVAPGKRPLSSMAPIMLFRDEIHTKTLEADNTNSNLGKLVVSAGASGGPKIITSLIQTILNHAFVGMPLYESVSAPRIHNQLLYHNAAGSLYEDDNLSQGPTIRLSKRSRMALTKRGHKLTPSELLGTVQAVGVDLETSLMTAVADLRKQGMPAGY